MRDARTISVGGYTLSAVPRSDWVVRGGDIRTAPAREKNLRDVHDAYELWGICVKAMPDSPSAWETARHSTVRSRTILSCLAGELEDAGIDVVQEPGKPWPDCLLLFQDEPGAEDWAVVERVFSERPKEANPSYRGTKPYKGPNEP
jgi:hypothetical protein